jgi:hypothetical protein
MGFLDAIGSHKEMKQYLIQTLSWMTNPHSFSTYQQNYAKPHRGS